MNISSHEAKETAERIDTIHWTFHVSILSMSRYRAILSDKKVFSMLFPNTQFENPKIQHTIENNPPFTTSKKEILETRNYDLYKAWQIALAITGMTSILEHYLKTIADKISGKSCKAMGIFYRFKKETGIKLTDYKNYPELRHFYEVRNITMHNLGRINPRFKDKTGEQHHKEGAYVFYPQQVTEYRNLIGEFLSFVEAHSGQ